MVWHSLNNLNNYLDRNTLVVLIAFSEEYCSVMVCCLYALVWYDIVKQDRSELLKALFPYSVVVTTIAPFTNDFTFH